jgi:hypothetical protein
MWAYDSGRSHTVAESWGHRGCGPRQLPAGKWEFAREAGAGTVADSDPVAENQERRNNAAVVIRVMRLRPARLLHREVQPVNAAVPFGTPSPDGPSYPVVAVQR